MNSDMFEILIKCAKPDACCLYAVFDASESDDGDIENAVAAVGDPKMIMFALSKMICELSDRLFDGNDGEFIDDLRTGVIIHRMVNGGEDK